jgi:uncharacterized protein
MHTEDVIRLLGLAPLPEEGGFYRETWRSALEIPEECLPAGYCGGRSFGTAIYYLITPESFSALHRVRGDEMFHFYGGDPVEMLLIRPDGSWETRLLGCDLAAGHLLQVVVPGGVWQGMRLAEGGGYALFGVTMAPGFDFADFESGDRELLVREHPELRELMYRFTR